MHFGFINRVGALTMGVRYLESETQKIEQFRSQYELHLMAIPGVTGIGTGMSSAGKICLKIYISMPTEQVFPNLPVEIKDIEYELEYIGEIKAQ